MKYTMGMTLLLAVVAAAPATAQVPVPSAEPERESVQEIVERSRIGPAVEGIAAEAVPELQEALESLASTIGILAGRIADDPELRASALRAAEGMIELSQAVVAERTDELLEALRAAAERISELSRGDDLDARAR